MKVKESYVRVSAVLSERPCLPIRAIFEGMCDSAVQMAQNYFLPEGQVPMAVVIVDPEITFGTPGVYNFDSNILFEKVYNADQSHIVNSIARSKAQVSWRTGLDSAKVSFLYPHLLQVGDTKYEGGVSRDGFVVGFSGLSWWSDQMVCEIIISLLKAHSIRCMRLIRDDKERKFL